MKKPNSQNYHAPAVAFATLAFLHKVSSLPPSMLTPETVRPMWNNIYSATREYLSLDFTNDDTSTNTHKE